MKPKYLCFTQDHNVQLAKEAFYQRYGCEAKEVKYEHGIMWVGPIPGYEYIRNDSPYVDLLDQNGDEMQLLMF
jgi:hypothetical protein